MSHQPDFTMLWQALEEGLPAGRGRPLRHFLPHLFRGLSLTGRTVLDIGGGFGECSCYAVVAGARAAVCVEPEAAGATAECTRAFLTLRERLGLETALTLAPTTLQAYDAEGQTFDLLLLHNSIHHLDEAHVGRLGSDAAAEEAYIKVLGKLWDLAAPGALLVIADASRNNLFTRLGLTNPFLPQIHYPNHPTPQTWARLLDRVGFVEPRLDWLGPRRLGPALMPLAANALGAFLMTGQFRLTMRRPAAAS